MKEHALSIGENGSLIGILSEGNVDAGQRNTQRGKAALLLNAGLIHHLGPNRIYVKLARMLAEIGLMVLRFDFSGIGDSGPRMDNLPANESILDDTRQAMDMLEAQYGIKEFICIGLCAGAAAASQISVADRRVKRVILIDPPLPRTSQTEVMYYSRYYHTRALFNPRSWIKFIFLKSNYLRIWKSVWLEIRSKFQSNAMLENESPEIIAELKGFFHKMHTMGMRLLIAFSEDDISEKYLQGVIGKEYNVLKQSGLMQTDNMIGADHLITPLACQNHLLELVTGWLQ